MIAGVLGSNDLMIKDIYLHIPFVGTIYLEYRGQTRASPFLITAWHKDTWLFCIGPLCGGASCSLKKTRC